MGKMSILFAFVQSTSSILIYSPKLHQIEYREWNWCIAGERALLGTLV